MNLFTPCDFNITVDTPDLEINSKYKLDSKTLLGIHSQSKCKLHDPGSCNCAMFVRYICMQYQ